MLDAYVGLPQGKDAYNESPFTHGSRKTVLDAFSSEKLVKLHKVHVWMPWHQEPTKDVV